MKTASRKGKARRLQNEIRLRLVGYFPELGGDIKTALMGEQGEDIKLSPAAQKLIPFAFEAKNQEKLNIWQALEQAEKYGRIPLVVFKRNRSKTYCALEFDTLLELLYGNN